VNEKDLILVKNPHSILAALKARPRDVTEITLPRDKSDDVWEQIQAVAARNKVRLIEAGSAGGRGGPGITRPGGSRRSVREEGPRPQAQGRESTHGAVMRLKEPSSVEAMFKDINDQTRGVWLALDTLQDPQNLGAIFRSAAFFGVRGIVMTSERSAPMTPTVYDIASGGVEGVPFAPVINLQRAFEKAKEAGLWILGTSEHAKDSLRSLKADRPWLVVMGNEENGLRRLTLEACDVTCGIPPAGDSVTSLNVSVATGVLLAHLSGGPNV
jgi:23S rRNA (guanosine2251-2'-O)-methyltransferase